MTALPTHDMQIPTARQQYVFLFSSLYVVNLLELLLLSHQFVQIKLPTARSTFDACSHPYRLRA